ncbi:hypothetical protein [Rhodococcus sp. T7]|uniref:hypothetical protein n=1 Tax=Rhodococcus sp. T7 TaxID=627444 RepID=UPI001357D9CB|nr:hypothetical protein [Rhodococcus sp. T7]KAF0958439.1 hypothetical protein MLGJGCBP_08481 [Rhodococcus sp. T7]
MIRCVRLWTGADDASHFEEGFLAMDPGRKDDLCTAGIDVTHLSFEETTSGGSFDWHTAPVRQLVLTLGGTLDFRTRGGDEFRLREGDVLLAEDTSGSGHEWTLVGSDPWRRAYVVLAEGAPVPFRTSAPSGTPVQE